MEFDVVEGEKVSCTLVGNTICIFTRSKVLNLVLDNSFGNKHVFFSPFFVF